MSGPEDLPTPTNSQSTDGSDETARASTQDQTQFQFESHTGTLEVAMDASQNDEWGDEDGEFELEEDMSESVVPTVNADNVVNAPDPIVKGGNEQPKSVESLPETIRYGRNAHKPSINIPHDPEEASKNESKAPQSQRRKSSSRPKRAASKSPTAMKRPRDQPLADADDIVCSLCHDGKSPKRNRIVLCDGCDTPYHQQCHDPKIDDQIVDTAETNWYCHKCSQLKRRKLATDVSGQGISKQTKYSYLYSLRKEDLIELLFFAENTSPRLPFYPSRLRERIETLSPPQDHPQAFTPSAAVSLTLDNINGIKGTCETNSQSPPTQQSVSPISPTMPLTTPNGGEEENKYKNAELPSYEEMIVRAATAINDPSGSAPKHLFDWMNANYKLHKNFRASASQALQKIVKKGRLIRNGSAYKINPDYIPPQNNRRNSKKPLITDEPSYKTLAADAMVTPESEPNENALYVRPN